MKPVKLDMTNLMDPEVQSTLGVQLETNFERMAAIALELVRVCEKKNAEYGSSWKIRGGRGAFFTFIRKADRIDTQCRLRQDNIFDVREDPNSSESIDETLRDNIAYSLLILEMREQIRREVSKKVPAPEGDGSEPSAGYVKQ